MHVTSHVIRVSQIHMDILDPLPLKEALNYMKTYMFLRFHVNYKQESTKTCMFSFKVSI